MKLTFKQAFESTFHSKYQFDDFLEANPVSMSNFLSHPSAHKPSHSYYQPNKALKNYLRFLNRFVFGHAQLVDEAVYSYRKEHSVLQALIKHTGNQCFLKTDLQSFFNSISADDVQRVIQKRLFQSPVTDLSDYQELLTRLVLIDGQLPIGFPTSPLISNSVLFEMDAFFYRWSQDNDVVYTRYSDDLIFSSSNDEQLKTLPALLENWLSSHYEARFKLNPSKSFFTHSGQKIKLLGLVLLPNGHITVPKNMKSKIETLMFYFAEDRDVFSDLLEKYFGNVSKLMGTLHYIQTIDKNYVLKLRKKYGNYTVDLFLHSEKIL